MKITKTVLTCDRCSVEMGGAGPLYVQVGWQVGAVSQEPDVRCVDLCHPCAMIALQRVCNMAADYTQAQDFVKAALDKSPLKKAELP